MGVIIPEGYFENIRFVYPKIGKEYLVYISGIYHKLRDDFGFVDIEELEISEIKIFKQYTLRNEELFEPELQEEIINLLKDYFDYNTYAS